MGAVQDKHEHFCQGSAVCENPILTETPWDVKQYSGGPVMLPIAASLRIQSNMSGCSNLDRARVGKLVLQWLFARTLPTIKIQNLLDETIRTIQEMCPNNPAAQKLLAQMVQDQIDILFPNPRFRPVARQTPGCYYHETGVALQQPFNEDDDTGMSLVDHFRLHFGDCARDVATLLMLLEQSQFDQPQHGWKNWAAIAAQGADERGAPAWLQVVCRNVTLRHLFLWLVATATRLNESEASSILDTLSQYGSDEKQLRENLRYPELIQVLHPKTSLLGGVMKKVFQ